jgi:cytochrome P450
MMHLTLDIVGRILFDVELLGEATALGRDITRVQRHAMLQLRVPFRLPFRWRAEAALARLNSFIYGLIAERRASGLDKGDLLSMLLLSTDEETGQHLSDKEIRDEAITLFLAGHETTAQAMAWSWYLLAQNPRYFARLREEGEPFALRVMKESMRLYPPAFVLARSALRDTSVGDFAVRKDELVFIAPWLFHRDARFFDDPLRFDPDRFLPEREAQLPRFAYMPFGGGRRICIGNQFALMEGQIILSTVARQFEMELLSHKPVGMEPLLTLRPKNGVKVRLRQVPGPGSRSVPTTHQESAV